MSLCTPSHLTTPQSCRAGNQGVNLNAVLDHLLKKLSENSSMTATATVQWLQSCLKASFRSDFNSKKRWITFLEFQIPPRTTMCTWGLTPGKYMHICNMGKAQCATVTSLWGKGNNRRQEEEEERNRKEVVAKNILAHEKHFPVCEAIDMQS